MSQSSLVTYTKLSPNMTAPRKGNISKIAIHHMAGNGSVESCGNIFASASRKASSHYGIGTDGRVGQYVHEENRAWTTGGAKTFNGITGANIDHMAVTIEVANDTGDPTWTVSDKAFDTLCDLVEDIARRNGIYPVTFAENGSGVIQAHRWYSATYCPGDYLYGKFNQLAEIVTERLKPECDPDPEPQPHWAEPWGEKLQKYGLISEPKNWDSTPTWGEVAVMLCNLIDKASK